MTYTFSAFGIAGIDICGLFHRHLLFFSEGVNDSFSPLWILSSFDGVTNRYPIHFFIIFSFFDLRWWITTPAYHLFLFIDLRWWFATTLWILFSSKGVLNRNAFCESCPLPRGHWISASFLSFLRLVSILDINLFTRFFAKLTSFGSVEDDVCRSLNIYW